MSRDPRCANLTDIGDQGMTATALDSVIFRDIFSTAEMRHVFSDEARTGYYLEIEAALARASWSAGSAARSGPWRRSAPTASRCKQS